LQLFFDKINTYFSKSVSVSGELRSPDPYRGASPMDPTAGLPSPDSHDLGPPLPKISTADPDSRLVISDSG